MEQERGEDLVFIAGARAGRGDLDGAFSALDRAVVERNPHLGSLNVFPLLRPIRGDPRYAALLRRLNLPVDSRPATAPRPRSLRRPPSPSSPSPT